MAKNKEITFKVKVVEDGQVIDKTVNSVNELEEAAKNARDALAKAPVGSKEFKELNNAVKQNEKALLKGNVAAKGLGGALGSIGGPIGGVIQGVGGLNKALLTLVANPIGAVIAAVVLALTGLFKAFTSTKEGAEQFDQVLAGISAAVDVVRDRVLQFAGAIAKFFSGDFKGAMEDARGAVSGIGAEILEEAKAAAALTDTLQGIDDAQRSLNVERAKQNALIADAKLKINDENLSYQERLTALEDVRKAEIDLAAQEEELARQRVEALRALNALSDSSAEDLDKLAEAEAAYAQRQQETKQKQKELFDQEKALRDKQRAEAEAYAKQRLAIEDQIRKAEQKNLLASIDDANERAEKQAEIERNEALISIERLDATEKEKARLREEAEEAYTLKLGEIEKKRQADADKAREEKEKKDEEARQKEIAKEKEKQDTLKAIAEATADTEEERRALEIQKIEEYYDKLIEQAEKLNLDTTALTDARNNAVDAKNKEFRDSDIQAEKDYERAKLEAKAQAVKDGLNIIADLVNTFAGENEKAQKRAFNVQKGVNIATATIDTYLAATKVLSAASANPATILFPGYPAIQAGLIIAAGLANVAKIASQKFQPAGGGAGGGDGAGGAGSSPSKFRQGGLLTGRSHAQGGIMSPFGELEGGEFIVNRNATQSFLPMLEKMNSLGQGDQRSMGNLSSGQENALMGQKQPIIKTYVVASEMSSQQEANKRISDIARL
jgi:hypothetical protein